MTAAESGVNPNQLQQNREVGKKVEGEPQAPTELPIEQMVQQQGMALGKVINYLRSNEMKQKQNVEVQKEKIEERKAWREEAQEAQKEYGQSSTVRRTLWGSLSYAGIIAGIQQFFTTFAKEIPAKFVEQEDGTIAKVAETVAAGPGTLWLQHNILPFIEGILPEFAFAGVAQIPFAGLIGASIIRTLPPWKAFEKKVMGFLDRRDPSFHKFEAIKALNPDDPQNQQVKEDIAKFENGAAQAAAEGNKQGGESPQVKVGQPNVGQRPAEGLKPQQVNLVPPKGEVKQAQIPPEVMELIQRAKAAQENKN